MSTSENARSTSSTSELKVVSAIDADGIAKPQEVKIHSGRFLDQLRSSPGVGGSLSESADESNIVIEDIEMSEAKKPSEAELAKYSAEIQQLTTTEDNDIEEPKLRAEYAIWKKNANYLYDLMITTRLGWPSFTVEWLPDIEQLDGGLKRHKLLLGTQTSGNANEFIRIGTIDLPETKAVPDLSKYDAEKGEIGGYQNSPHSHFSIRQYIDHYGEINKASYMPQNPSMIASMSSNGVAYVFDCTKHSLQSQGGNPRPDIVLQHHKEEGFALSWNKYKAGTLATGAGDSTVALWNVKNFRKSKPLTPMGVIRTHTDVVNSVEWHNFHSAILGSVSDDKKIHIHDTRVSPASSTPAAESRSGHTGPINCISFNPANENFLATGSNDRSIMLWDLRNMYAPLHAMTNGHSDNVDSIAWSPHFETVLASVSLDRRVMIWDTAQIGAQQTPEEQEQGPPELLFIHGGHTESVSDVAWSPQLPWVLASVSNDNHLHIFRPAETIVGQRS